MVIPNKPPRNRSLQNPPGIVEECDRKLLELASQMTMVEESHRHDVEQLRSEIQGISQEIADGGWGWGWEMENP